MDEQGTLSQAGLSLPPFTVQMDVANRRVHTPRGHLDRFPRDLSSLLLFKPASKQWDCGTPGWGCCCHKGEKQQVVGTVHQAAQCRWKRKPAFLITPSTEGNVRAPRPQQVTSHGGWHWLSDCLPTASLFCTLVLSLVDTIFLWRLTKPLLAGANVQVPHSEAPGEAAHYTTRMLLGELWERGEARHTASICTKNIL